MVKGLQVWVPVVERAAVAKVVGKVVLRSSTRLDLNEIPMEVGAVRAQMDGTGRPTLRGGVRRRIGTMRIGRGWTDGQIMAIERTTRIGIGTRSGILGMRGTEIEEWILGEYLIATIRDKGMVTIIAVLMVQRGVERWGIRSHPLPCQPLGM